MNKKKKITYGILVLVVLLVLASLDTLIVKNNPDFMDASMDMLGEKLVAMVPEGKEAVRGLFDQFVSQVQAEQVTPEQVERVAANILNLSNQEAKLSPEDVESFFAMSSNEVEPVAIVMTDTVGGDVKVISRPMPASKAKLRKPIDQKRFDALGHRLKALIDLNEFIKPKVSTRTQYRFQVDDGIVISVDPEIEKSMDKKAFQELSREFQALQERKMLSWRENLSKQHEETMRKKQQELEVIKKLRQQEHEFDQMEAKISMEIRALEHLKQLEAMGFTAAFQTDSIHIIIQEKVKEAKEAVARAKSKKASEDRR